MKSKFIQRMLLISGQEGLLFSKITSEEKILFYQGILHKDQTFLKLS